MSRLKRLVAVILTFSIIFSVATFELSFDVAAGNVQIAYVTGNNVNVRQTASLNGAVLDQVSYRRVTVLGKTGDWLNISYLKSGKVINGYIKNVSDWIVLADYNTDLSFENQLANFPTTYHAGLRALHNKYPNWVFVPDNVNMEFYTATALQGEGMRKQVSLNDHPVSWRSMGKGVYDWSTEKWIDNNAGYTGASREIIEYYMDPRNFLDDSGIFMFLQQSYGNGQYTEAGLKKVVNETFLATAEYINIIMRAGEQSGVSPYIIASKIIQEQGTKGESSLISGTYSGYTGYYNYFNFKASGSTDAEVIKNGLQYAKEQGWNTPEKAIVGGAKKYATDYIELGQDTYYYQDFNVHFKDYLWHQYAQAVHDAYSKGSNLNEVYTAFTDAQLVFRIPVYKSMPGTICRMPVSNSSLNNYYFETIYANGLTPSFYRYTYKYDLAVAGDTVIALSIPKNATVVSNSEFNLTKGNNTVDLIVKSQTGYTNSYTITVYASNACKLRTSFSKADTVKKGDIDGDNNITINDIGRIRQHLLKKYLIDNATAAAADIDNDGNITINDIGRIRQHLLGKYLIS